MTKLNNETRELSIDDLEALSNKSEGSTLSVRLSNKLEKLMPLLPVRSTFGR